MNKEILEGKIRCYNDEGGYPLVTIKAKAGDKIKWKKNGARGTYNCRIVKFSESHNKCSGTNI